jgi:DNA-directed RNA polymerase specialized sigma24 family protein
LCEHVAHLERSAESVHLLERLSACGLNPERAEDLGALVRKIETPCGRCRRIVTACVLATMGPRSKTAALCAIALLRPELEWMVLRLVGAGLDPEEGQAEAVAAAWEVLAAAPGRGTNEYVTLDSLVNAIWICCRRSAGVRRSGSVTFVGLPADLDIAAPETDPFERWPGLLATAVSAGVLTARQVVVIAQTRVEGRSLDEVAKILGRPYDAVKKERQRAEAALRTFALAYSSEGLR